MWGGAGDRLVIVGLGEREVLQLAFASCRALARLLRLSSRLCQMLNRPKTAGPGRRTSYLLAMAVTGKLDRRPSGWGAT